MSVLWTEEAGIRILLESEGDFSLHDRVALVFSEELFLSVRQIAKKVMMSKSTVYWHLTMKLQHLKWVPRSLTDSEKMNRVESATELLELM
jgi:hypothetical protein